MVDLDQTDAGLVVLTGDNRGVSTGSETDRNRGLQIIGRNEPIAGDRRRLVWMGLPVVIRR